MRELRRVGNKLLERCLHDLRVRELGELKVQAKVELDHGLRAADLIVSNDHPDGRNARCQALAEHAAIGADHHVMLKE